MLTSKTSSPLAIRSHRPLVHYHENGSGKNRNNDSTIGTIEIEWKETKRVRFDPDMDWKMEGSKADTRHLRLQAGREIRKRIEIEKKQQQQHHHHHHHHDHYHDHYPSEQADRKLSTYDRQKEAFLYICFCDVDLLVGQFNTSSNDTVVLTRLFDALFKDAGIKPLCERETTPSSGITTTRSETTNDVTTNANDSWLWVSFFALQIEYRRIYDTTTIQRNCATGTTTTSCSSSSSRSSRTSITCTAEPGFEVYSFASRLSRNATQALFFIHWLSPVFRFEEKESKQRQVYSLIMGDNNRDGRDYITTSSSSSAPHRFEDYIFQDRDIEGNEDDGNLLKDLRFQLHRFFGSAFCGVSSLELSQSSSHGSRDRVEMELGVYFATIRSSNDNADDIDEIGCDWAACSSSCEDPHQNHHKQRRRFAYELLNSESKHLLFLISAMPAFRSYYYDYWKRNGDSKWVMVQQLCNKDIDNKTHRLSLVSSPSSTLGFSQGRNNSNTSCASEIDPNETSADMIHCDNCPLLSNYEYEFTQEICNLLFERA